MNRVFRFGDRSLLSQQIKDTINWQDLGLVSEVLIKIRLVDYIILE